jgi:hypothetical protein
MIIPGRNCVARILFAPDAYGVLGQATAVAIDRLCRVTRRSKKVTRNRGLSPLNTYLSKSQSGIIDGGAGHGQREYAGGRVPIERYAFEET